MNTFAENDEFHQCLRADFDREIESEKSKAGSLDLLWSSIREFVNSINSRLVKSSSDYSHFQQDFHTLWYMFIRAAQNVDADSAEQDRIHNQLVYAKSLGKLFTTGEIALAWSSWLSLPYLLNDFQLAWVSGSQRLTSVERRNFATFTARLLALGTCDVKISQCALWLLRETLEVTRQIEPDSTTQELALSEMLPAVIEWFKISSIKLLCLSIHQWVDEEGSSTGVTSPGDLAQVEDVRSPGFSIPRWVFWRKRLVELCYYHGASSVSASARIGFDNMIITGRTIGYDIPGERSYWSRVERALEVELKRSGKPSISLDDVTTEPAWANEGEPLG